MESKKIWEKPWSEEQNLIFLIQKSFWMQFKTFFFDWWAWSPGNRNDNFSEKVKVSKRVLIAYQQLFPMFLAFRMAVKRMKFGVLTFPKIQDFKFWIFKNPRGPSPEINPSVIRVLIFKLNFSCGLRTKSIPKSSKNNYPEVCFFNFVKTIFKELI